MQEIVLSTVYTYICVLCLCVCVCVPVLQTHSNETVGSIRWKISEHLSCPVDNVQIFANDSVVSVNDSVSNTDMMLHFNFV